jgi:hypothetical protein
MTMPEDRTPKQQHVKDAEGTRDAPQPGGTEVDNVKAFLAWQATMARRAHEAAKHKDVDWKNMTIDPSKLGVEMGPALTEEQFQEYCKNTGIRPQVLRKK